LRWCAENGIDPEDVEIEVVVCDNCELIAAAAEPGPGQEAAIEAIYEEAGV